MKKPTTSRNFTIINEIRIVTSGAPLNHPSSVAAISMAVRTARNRAMPMYCRSVGSAWP
jgi:hypothetical protein